MSFSADSGYRGETTEISKYKKKFVIKLFFYENICMKKVFLFFSVAFINDSVDDVMDDTSGSEYVPTGNIFCLY